MEFLKTPNRGYENEFEIAMEKLSTRGARVRKFSYFESCSLRSQSRSLWEKRATARKATGAWHLSPVRAPLQDSDAQIQDYD